VVTSSDAGEAINGISSGLLPAVENSFFGGEIV